MPTGILLSVPLYLAFFWLMDIGAANKLGVAYPQLSATQIADWPGFLDILRSASQADEATDQYALWNALTPETSRQAILDLTDDATVDRRAGVCVALTDVLSNSAVFNGEHAASGDDNLWLNRQRVDLLFGDTLTGNPHQGWYAPVKLIYSFVYALVMWLLVFGTLGAFQDLCASHSRRWRYIADSSYWIYLVHIPIVPALQVWMYDWPLPSLIKLVLQLAIASVLMFGSYHYLVRPTAIGQILNGRRFPIKV